MTTENSPSVGLPDTDTLPLTQQLVMEVMAARYRLGENIWPFDRRAKNALAALSQAGYIGFKSGIVDHTFNVWLTDEGKAACMSATYKMPRPRVEQNDGAR
jgi:hypothetical protein